MQIRNKQKKSMGVSKNGIFSRSKKCMVECNIPQCGIHAHSQVAHNDKHHKLQLPLFKGMSCFEIAPNRRMSNIFSLYRRKNYQAKINDKNITSNL